MSKYANLCKVDDCSGKSKSLGYCNKHYARYRKYGDPLFTKIAECKNKSLPGTPLKDRIVESVLKDDSGCWLWQKALFVDGYGSIGVDGAVLRAHRASYSAFVGDIPEGMVVCHKCDVPSCVNPDHLFIGTVQDNTDDKVQKDRVLRGERVGNSKLTSDDVREIRSLIGNLSHSAIASEFGVTPGLITQINLGKVWSHIS